MEKSNNNEDVQKFAVCYIRKSTEEQSFFSLQSQEEYCIREAQARGLEIYIFFTDDGFSAKTINRPGLTQLLDICTKKNSNIVALIVYKIDRLSRDTADYLGLRKLLAKYGINIISCTEPTDNSPAGEFIETILAATAKFENMVKAERSRNGVISRIKSGLPHGRVPLGYKNVILPDNKRIVEKDPKSFDFVKNAWLMMETGSYSLDDIAQYLNSNNVTLTWKKQQKPITKQYLSKMFQDKTYCGYAISRKHNLEIKSDQIPQMIFEDTFVKVRSILLKRNNAPNIYQKIRPEFPLRGFLLCSFCNKPLRAGFSKGRSKYYGYYFCQDHATPSISSEIIDEALLNLLRSLTPDPILRKLFLDEVKRKWSDKYMAFVKQEEQMKGKLEEFKKMKRMVAEKNLNGTYADDFAKEMIEEIDNKIFIQHSLVINESKLARDDMEILTTFMNGFLEDLGKVYLQAKNEQLKRYLIGSIFPKKLIFKNGNLEPLGLSPCFALINDLKQGSVVISAEERT